MTVEELGEWVPPYRRTYDGSPEFIDSTHRRLADVPLHDGLVQLRDGSWLGEVIRGWLRLEDALKLYEMAFFACGDILELGSFHGLSTAVIAYACHNSDQTKRIESVDSDPFCTSATRRTVISLGLSVEVTYRTQDAVAALQEYIETLRKFAFVFVDHSHTYPSVYDVCLKLGDLVEPGGFCLFHDFNDARNRERQDYGVYQAVINGLDDKRFEFYGIYGCTALYRRVT